MKNIDKFYFSLIILETLYFKNGEIFITIKIGLLLIFLKILFINKYLSEKFNYFIKLQFI